MPDGAANAGKRIVSQCRHCGRHFSAFRSANRKFCDRQCYRQSMHDFDNVAYPRIWYKGRRELLHRVIYMEISGETLGPNDIIHHIDENPYNRDPINLKKVVGKWAHLAEHNFYRGRRRRSASLSDAEIAADRAAGIYF